MLILAPSLTPKQLSTLDRQEQMLRVNTARSLKGSAGPDTAEKLAQGSFESMDAAVDAALSKGFGHVGGGIIARAIDKIVSGSREEKMAAARKIFVNAMLNPSDDMVRLLTEPKTEAAQREYANVVDRILRTSAIPEQAEERKRRRSS